MTEQLQILPLCLIMVMGPQIMTAIFLVTSGTPVKNSVALLIGVTGGGVTRPGDLVRASQTRSGSTRATGDSGPSTADYVVSGLLAVLAVRVFMTRGTAETPKWMSASRRQNPSARSPSASC